MTLDPFLLLEQPFAIASDFLKFTLSRLSNPAYLPVLASMLLFQSLYCYRLVFHFDIDPTPTRRNQALKQEQLAREARDSAMLLQGMCTPVMDAACRCMLKCNF